MIENALAFKDTVFYKEDSDLQRQYDALIRLKREFPNNKRIDDELYMARKGLEGENEIAYQLKKSHIGMYVLRDVKYEYADMTAQIDYIIITPIFIYYVECKNLIGDITVDSKGDFVRKYNVNGKIVKTGMKSPLRQVEAQREVIRKMWEDNTSKLIKVFANDKFDHYRRVLVVFSNPDTILDTHNAPKYVRDKVIKSDSLVRLIEKDYNDALESDDIESRNEMERVAKSYIHFSTSKKVDYYEYYKNELCKSLDLRQRLIDFRANRSKEKNIPEYYIFTDEELEKLLEIKPKTIEDLWASNILPDIKVKSHGYLIVDMIRKEF